MSRKVDQFNKKTLTFYCLPLIKYNMCIARLNLGIVGSEQEQIVLGIRILIDFQLSE